MSAIKVVVEKVKRVGLVLWFEYERHGHTFKTLNIAELGFDGMNEANKIINKMTDDPDGEYHGYMPDCLDRISSSYYPCKILTKINY